MLLTKKQTEIVIILGKQQQKYIQSLHNKKYRKQFNRFLVEGKKSMEELLKSDFEMEFVCLNKQINEIETQYSGEIYACTPAELDKISTFKNNTYGLAVAKMKEERQADLDHEEWILALDDIRDPGNLGTIIRLADWYGIKNIVCSEDTVEFYNPKVISSTMGSFTRVNVFYTSLTEFLKDKANIAGAFLNGENVHKYDFPQSGILVIGSESHGISENVSNMLHAKLTIPAYGYAESLNAAVATGILLDNLRRNSR